MSENNTDVLFLEGALNNSKTPPLRAPEFDTCGCGGVPKTVVDVLEFNPSTIA